MVSSSDFVYSGQDRLPGGEKEYEIFHIATSLTPWNSMSPIPMFFSKIVHCIVSILCEHGKEQGDDTYKYETYFNRT